MTAPRPNAAHLKLWQALVAKAEAAAKHPERDPAGLFRAAKRAGKAVMPVGHQTRESPFNRLVGGARAFSVVGPDQRRDLAGRLADLATECRAVLEAPEEAPPVRRPRADVDGWPWEGGESSLRYRASPCLSAEPGRAGPGRAGLRAWLAYVAQEAIDWLDALDREDEDREDEEGGGE